MPNTKGSKGHDRAAHCTTGDPAHNQIIIAACPEAAALQQGMTAHREIVEIVVDTSRTRLLARPRVKTAKPVERLVTLPKFAEQTRRKRSL